MLALVDWSAVIATIPVTITALAGLIAALKANSQAKQTRIECAVAHQATNDTITAVGDQVVSAANDAATTAAEVKAALDVPPGAPA